MSISTIIYRTFFKRIIDAILSFIGLLIFSPLFAILITLLGFLNEGKPFFLQKRPGKKEKIFTLIKFRTMNNKKDHNGNLLPDYKRLTKIGRFLRKTSLDEIPQLFNVLKGDMSLVGPRPLLIEYLPLYNKEQARRHEIRPGITGWAQVNGRNSISWQQKFNLDVWYVDHLSLILDIKILAITLSKIFKPKDVNASGNITMEKFTGN